MTDWTIIAFMFCFYVAGLCLLFFVAGVLAHVFHAPLERLAERLVR